MFYHQSSVSFKWWYLCPLELSYFPEKFKDSSIFVKNTVKLLSKHVWGITFPGFSFICFNMAVLRFSTFASSTFKFIFSKNMLGYIERAQCLTKFTALSEDMCLFTTIYILFSNNCLPARLQTPVAIVCQQWAHTQHMTCLHMEKVI